MPSYFDEETEKIADAAMAVIEEEVGRGKVNVADYEDLRDAVKALAERILQVGGMRKAISSVRRVVNIAKAPLLLALGDSDGTARGVLLGDIGHLGQGGNDLPKEIKAMEEKYAPLRKRRKEITALLAAFHGDAARFASSFVFRVFDKTGSGDALEDACAMLEMAKKAGAVDENDTAVATVETLAGFAKVSSGRNMAAQLSALRGSLGVFLRRGDLEGMEFCAKLAEQGVGTEGIDFFGKMLNEPSSRRILLHMAADEFGGELVTAAVRHGAGAERYRMVSFMHAGGDPLDIEGLFAMEEGALRGRLERMLGERGISHPDALSDEEKIKVMQSLSSRSEEEAAEDIAALDELMRLRRMPGGQMRGIERIKSKGFCAERLQETAIIGELPLDAKGVQMRIEPEALVNDLAASISGRNGGDARARLSQVFSLDKIGSAQGEWARIMHQEPDANLALRNFISGDREISHLSLLQHISSAARNSASGAGRDALLEMANTVRGAFDTSSITNGSRIIAYTVKGNGNALVIESPRTGCCAFDHYTGGLKGPAGYAADPAVILVQFAAARTMLRSPEELNPIGVAITALGIERDGSRVLFVNSTEGGIEFRRAVSGHEGWVLEMLRKRAAMTGAQVLVFGTDVLNETPREIVNRLSGKGSIGREETVELMILCRMERMLDNVRTGTASFERAKAARCRV